ncbi:hypothetical protein MAR_015565 [Mya arenaria]|uniref:Uncharacterized protein n=1 Tax=Mya arenaria TaxID=6604 RepID=A0ABY7FLI2_MYAAR|nr:hypothetical protein MAR_015565 [Mya arenaria]
MDIFYRENDSLPAKVMQLGAQDRSADLLIVVTHCRRMVTSMVQILLWVPFLK